MQYYQYVLIEKKTGNAATISHQDDMETPLVATDLESLIADMDIWADRSVIKKITDTGEYTDDDGDVYEIVCEKVQQLALDQDDLKELADLKAKSWS